MTMTLNELRDALSKSDIEEQKLLIQQFMQDSTTASVLEGMRIANESFLYSQQEFVISSHVKE